MHKWRIFFNIHLVVEEFLHKSNF